MVVTCEHLTRACRLNHADDGARPLICQRHAVRDRLRHEDLVGLRVLALHQPEHAVLHGVHRAAVVVEHLHGRVPHAAGQALRDVEIDVLRARPPAVTDVAGVAAVDRRRF